jgi:hypothetical protein
LRSKSRVAPVKPGVLNRDYFLDLIAWRNDRDRGSLAVLWLDRLDEGLEDCGESLGVLAENTRQTLTMNGKLA